MPPPATSASDNTRAAALMVGSMAFFAEVFERSIQRVVVNRGGNVDAAATKHLIDLVEERFDSANGRVIAGKKALPKVAASVEILPAP